MFVYKFGSSDFVTKESKVNGKNAALKQEQNSGTYFPNTMSQLYLHSFFMTMDISFHLITYIT
jgi:hypothetical protein